MYRPAETRTEGPGGTTVDTHLSEPRSRGGFAGVAVAFTVGGLATGIAIGFLLCRGV